RSGADDCLACRLSVAPGAKGAGRDPRARSGGHLPDAAGTSGASTLADPRREPSLAEGDTMDRTLETSLPELLSLPAAARGDLPRKTEKPWGHELLWAWGRYYAAKILHIEAGQRLSLQYHRVKEETLLLLSGRLWVGIEGADGRMEMREARAGQPFHIPPGCKHRLAALETGDVLEVST